MRAFASVELRNVMVGRSTRLGGIARTRWMMAACSGLHSAAYRNRERMAVRRALRVRAPLPRSASRWSRKAQMRSASRSSHASEDGGLPMRDSAKESSSRSVSR
jgi:hypothetical protein